MGCGAGTGRGACPEPAGYVRKDEAAVMRAVANRRGAGGSVGLEREATASDVTARSEESGK